MPDVKATPEPDNSLEISAEELAIIQAHRSGKVSVSIAPAAESVYQDPAKVQKDIKDINPDPLGSLKSIPRHKQEAYVKWHRECHTRETHFEWCKENNVTFSWQPLQPRES